MDGNRTRNALPPPVDTAFERAPEAAELEPEGHSPLTLIALLEIVVLVIIPGTLDYAAPSFPTLSEMQPHFFWLPVLLLSLQYGTVSGLMTAGVAILVSAVLGWPDQEIGENHFVYLLRIWTQPVLWLATALVIGQFRMRQISRKQELLRQVAVLSQQRATLAGYGLQLRDRCERLERAMASLDAGSSRETVAALLGLIDRGEGFDQTAAAARALTACFGECQASIFVRDGGGLRLVYAHRWPPRAVWQSLIPAGHVLYDSIVGAATPLCIAIPADEANLAHEGLAATPILSPVTGDVVGMMKLERAAPEEVDAMTARRLGLLAVLLGPMLREVRQGSLVESRGFAAAPIAPLRPRVWRQLKRRPAELGDKAGAERIGRKLNPAS